MKNIGIVLAAFGVSKPGSAVGITNVLDRVREEFPKSKVKLAFTSNQIRHKWQRRSRDSDWLRANPGISTELLQVRGVLAAIADLQDEGCRRIVVQPLHIYAGEEYSDLQSYVTGLNSIRTTKPRWTPFKALALGRPALGKPGPEFPYQKDLARAAQALAPDAREALAGSAALVYGGHGNPFYSTGVYQELELILSRNHPGLRVIIGVVEGIMGPEYVLERLRSEGIEKVLLKPLMLVAGEHAHSDLCGDEPDSWRAIFEKAGVEVECDLTGLGENPDWVDIYVQNIKQTAEMHKIEH